MFGKVLLLHLLIIKSTRHVYLCACVRSLFVSKKLIIWGNERYRRLSTDIGSCSKINASSRDTVERTGGCFFRLNRMSAGPAAPRTRRRKGGWKKGSTEINGLLIPNTVSPACWRVHFGTRTVAFVKFLNRYGSATPASPRSNDTCDIFILRANSNDPLFKVINFRRHRVFVQSQDFHLNFSIITNVWKSMKSRRVSNESERDKEMKNTINKNVLQTTKKSLT